MFEGTRSPIAEAAVRRIGALYDIEAAISGQSAERRLAARQERAVPLLTDLNALLVEQRRRLSSKNVLAKATQYALTRWEALERTQTTAGSLSTTMPPSEAYAASP